LIATETIEKCKGVGEKTEGNFKIF